MATRAEHLLELLEATKRGKGRSFITRHKGKISAVAGSALLAGGAYLANKYASPDIVQGFTQGFEPYPQKRLDFPRGDVKVPGSIPTALTVTRRDSSKQILKDVMSNPNLPRSSRTLSGPVPEPTNIRTRVHQPVYGKGHSLQQRDPVAWRKQLKDSRQMQKRIRDLGIDRYRDIDPRNIAQGFRG